MDNLIQKRGIVKGKITRFTNHVNDFQMQFISDPSSITREGIIQLTGRLVVAKTLLQAFEDIHEQIIILDSDPIHEEQHVAFETDFFTATSLASRLLEECDATSMSEARQSPPSSLHSGNSHTSSSNFIRLPAINLPKYSGNLEDWLAFRDTFDSLINQNVSINNIQKFHYLKASLEGSALQVIQSLDFTASNYHLAWDTLCKRYNNTRMIVHNHVKSLFGIESVSKESSDRLRQINDLLSKHMGALRSLSDDTPLLETFVIHVVATKLDSTTLREWESARKTLPQDLPALAEFQDFLKSQADLLSTLKEKSSKCTPERHEKSKPSSKAFVAASNAPSCHNCKGSHLLSSCSEFLKLSIQNRVSRVKELKLCLNCLYKGHMVSQCSSRYTCRKCKLKHHTLLHQDVSRVQSSPISTEASVSASSAAGTPDNTVVSAFSANRFQVILPTMSAQIINSDGQLVKIRVLLDSGSQSNFITSDTCNRLRLLTKPIDVSVSGLGKATSQIRSHSEVTLFSSYHSKFKLTVSCLVIDQITSNLPNWHVDINKLNIPDNICLSDPDFHKPGSIDMLLGSTVFFNVLCSDQICLGSNLPTLQKTRFGYVVAGPLGPVTPSQTLCHHSTSVAIQEQLSRFWELEQYPCDKVLSQEENACEEHFSKNFERAVYDGRFVVQIPFKADPSILGDSFQTALRRFTSLEKKLQSNSDFKERYISFMQEYIDLGHMTLSDVNYTGPSFYLPHHGVFKEESLTTKLRVVFDGSSKTSSGHSLNDIQMVGPTIQQDLFSILVRFRKHTFALSADIEKMYRQILIHPSQRPLQRILWRSSPLDPISTFDLNTVTYGTAAASFLAIRCLTEVGISSRDTHPQFSEIIQKDFYVDDLLTGSDVLLDAQAICRELPNLLAQGGFKLRKWISNSAEVLSDVESSDIHPGFLDFGVHEHTKTLGLVWAFQADNLQYSISDSSDGSPTKRSMLSDISQIFDPLGLLAPCVILAKIFMQLLWMEKVSWDDPIPATIQNKWIPFRRSLLLLNDLTIPRHVLCTNFVCVEMHGFSDASLQAYGASIYLRSIDLQGQVHVHLLCAKAKVAPLKPLTIPRLELCAAALLAKLAFQVSKSLDVNLNRSIFWSDSTVVLGWLKTPPNQLKTFVCNRVADIQTLTAHATWRHVPTQSNPADLLSRGASPSQLLNSTLWWNGPSWLYDPESSWPVSVDRASNLPDLKTITQCHHEVQIEPFPWDEFSNLTRLERVIAYCLRFVNNSRRPPSERHVDPFTPEEIASSHNCLIKIAQRDSFSEDLRRLQANLPILKPSSITSLTPFIDDTGVIRVGGRLQNSQFPYNKKHPILLSNKHKFSKLLLIREHTRLLHAGAQLLLSHVREHYWIVSGRNLAKAVVHNCIRCFRFSSKLTKPIMGNLPATRVAPSPPFSVVGVDYAGPFSLKDRKGRGAKTYKSYLCLFVCFATKAIHLELVTDLSTDSFLMTFRRFIARRGKPNHVYSDNGSNFVGASSELRELGKFLLSQQIVFPERITDLEINWHFIPAHSPHFGRLWEAGVKSCKHHVRRVLGSTLLTYEQFSTVLVQVEAILNSRPLSPLSSDPNDLLPLTPGHFLIGRPLMSALHPILHDIKESRLDAYQRIELLRQQIWSRWSKEYVSELQQRQKWRSNSSGLRDGDLVLIKDNNLPPMQWRLGRIVGLHPGSDGISRVASIKTSAGVIRRSFAKICPLPVDDVKKQ